MGDNVRKSYVINDLFEEYIKNPYNSIIKRQPTFKELAKNLTEYFSK